MRSFQFNGVAVAAVTPFTKSGTIDVALLRDLIEWWIAEGIEGIVLCGSTGEMAYLSAEERLSLFEIGVSAVRGRVPLIAGSGFPSTKATLETTQAAAELGVDAALLVTPFYYALSEEAFITHYQTIAEGVALPLLLYNMPSLTRVNLSSDVVQKLSQIDGIVGIKDSAGDFAQLKSIIDKTRPDFCTLTGSFSLLCDALAGGANGAILALANLIPAACVNIGRFAADGKISDAQELLQTFAELQDWVKAHGIPGIKHKLAELNHPAGWPRPPLLPMS